MSGRRVAALIAMLTAVVPIYLCAAIAEDTLLGERQFLLALAYGGNRRLLARVLQVAAESAVMLLPFAAMVFALLRVTAGRRVAPALVVALAVVCGLLLSRTLSMVVPAMTLTALALFAVDRLFSLRSARR